MSVRFIFQFNKMPSHALIVCTPWTRLLVQTEFPSGTGHVIGDALRKIANECGNTTAVEVHQLRSDPTKAQHYLHAAEWWLHRTPFGDVERLPVKVVANKYEGSLASVDGWNVTSLMVNRDGESVGVTLESLGSLPVNLKELRLYQMQISDLSPLLDLEILSVRRSPDLRDLSALQGCFHLRVLDVSNTQVENLTALIGVLPLDELDCSWTNVDAREPLAT